MPEDPQAGYLRKYYLWFNPCVALLCLALVGSLYRHLMEIFQQRPGIQLVDLWLDWIGPWQLSHPIFVTTYGTLLFGSIGLIKNRWQITHFIYVYSLLQLLRIVCIYLVPLDPPSTMIQLSDPINDRIIFGSVITKDLFFSGHVSVAWLLSFYYQSTFRWLLRLIALFLAFMLTAQHVHYTIDVIFAPAFAYLAFRLVPQSIGKSKHNVQS